MNAGSGVLRLIAAVVVSLMISAGSLRAEEPARPVVKGYPAGVSVVEYPATIDQSQQPMLLYEAKGEGARPLLVGLHTWSGDFKQAGGEAVYARWCIERDWHFIHPDFRGPNWTPDACGSEKAVQDIIDAVEFMKRHHRVDLDRIYLVGVSGGGHASLLLAGRAPELWAGVSAWVPISDIGAWWEQKRNGNHSKYADHIEKCVGGRPDENEAVALDCARRSPLTYLHRARGVNLDISAGVTDGHAGGSVPFTHSLHAFNGIVPEAERIGGRWIDAFYEAQALPRGSEKPEPDRLYGEKEVLFRKVSENARVTIFQGKHEIIHHAALNWLAAQRRGKPASWNVAEVFELDTAAGEGDSGK